MINSFTILANGKEQTHQAAVNISQLFQLEQVRRMLRVLEEIGRGAIHGDAAGSSLS